MGATEKITDSPLEVEKDTTTETDKLDEMSEAIDGNTTEAEVETASVEDDESMISITPAVDQTDTDSEVKDTDTTTSSPTIVDTEVEGVETSTKDESIDATTKTADKTDDYDYLLKPNEETIDTTTVSEEESQGMVTDSSLPSEDNASIRDDAVETTTKLDMETTTAAKDTDEMPTEKSMNDEEDVSSTVSSVTEPQTEMISTEDETTLNVEEKIMDDETTTPANEIETDDLTTPEIETEVTLRPAMPRLDTSEEVSTTVVVEEVPAITTETNIDSLSLVTEGEETVVDTTASPIVEPSEETGSDIEDLGTTTITSIDAASLDTESEVEATETTLSSIDKKPLDASSETEVLETTVTPTDTSSVTVISVSEEDDMVTIVTMRPTTVQQSDIDVSSVETTTVLSDVTMVGTEGPESTEDDKPATTTMQSIVEDETSTLSDQEFLCTQTDDIMENNEDIPMKCKHSTGDEEKTVFLIIPKESLGDVTLDRLFDKNVKIIVKDFMIMDRSPRRL